MSAAIEFAWTPGKPETELCALLGHAPIAFAQLLALDRIVALNPPMELLLTRPDATGRIERFAELLDPQNQDEAERLLSELFLGERESFEFDSKASLPAGTVKRWTAWRVSGPPGSPDYALAVAEDVLIDRESEQRLRQAEKLESVGRLAGGIAHDFNNLLTGVLLYCDLLMASLDPGHRVHKYAQEIRNASMQASGLVRQLLTVARPTNSEPCLLSLNDIAEAMRNLLVRLIGENIELAFNLDPNLGLVKMDPTQAQQVLLNLVLNARDAMPRGGRIQIETGTCRLQVLAENQIENAALLPCALFIVADNGCGMDAATRDHLFEAFFTTKSRGKGTGLGLATVRDIVSKNGGLIHVNSAPGCGTRITVILPLVRMQPPLETLNPF
ncbi:MAG: ATP-binding protein [Candidatus Sulfotelmatobacter sp.]